MLNLLSLFLYIELLLLIINYIYFFNFTECQEYGKSVIQVIESYGLTYEKKYVNDSRCRMLKGNGFIVGGEDAELGDFPHAVSLTITPNIILFLQCWS